MVTASVVATASDGGKKTPAAASAALATPDLSLKTATEALFRSPAERACWRASSRRANAASTRPAASEEEEEEEEEDELLFIVFIRKKK